MKMHMHIMRNNSLENAQLVMELKLLVSCGDITIETLSEYLSYSRSYLYQVLTGKNGINELMKKSITEFYRGIEKGEIPIVTMEELNLIKGLAKCTVDRINKEYQIYLRCSLDN